MSCPRVSRSSAISLSVFAIACDFTRMCESILSTAPSTVSTGRRIARRRTLLSSSTRPERRPSRVKRLHVPAGKPDWTGAECRGATSTGCRVRRARRHDCSQGGIRDRRSPRKRERIWARPQLRGNRSGLNAQSSVTARTKALKARASPQGVERAAPDQGHGRQAESPKDARSADNHGVAPALREQSRRHGFRPDAHSAAATAFRRFGMRTGAPATPIAASGASAAT